MLLQEEREKGWGVAIVMACNQWKNCCLMNWIDYLVEDMVGRIQRECSEVVHVVFYFLSSLLYNTLMCGNE